MKLRKLLTSAHGSGVTHTRRKTNDDMETNVELEVLDDAELDEVTGGLLDFSGIRTINLSTSSSRPSQVVGQ